MVGTGLIVMEQDSVDVSLSIRRSEPGLYGARDMSWIQRSSTTGWNRDVTRRNWSVTDRVAYNNSRR